MAHDTTTWGIWLGTISYQQYNTPWKFPVWKDDTELAASVYPTYRYFITYLYNQGSTWLDTLLVKTSSEVLLISRLHETGSMWVQRLHWYVIIILIFSRTLYLFARQDIDRSTPSSWSGWNCQILFSSREMQFEDTNPQFTMTITITCIHSHSKHPRSSPGYIVRRTLFQHSKTEGKVQMTQNSLPSNRITTWRRTRNEVWKDFPFSLIICISGAYLRSLLCTGLNDKDISTIPHRKCSRIPFSLWLNIWYERSYNSTPPI